MKMVHYAIYLTPGVRSVSLQRHTDPTVQRLSVHMLFSCFQAQTITRCAVQSGNGLTMLTTATQRDS